MSFASALAPVARAVTQKNSLLGKLVRWQAFALLLLITSVCVTLYFGLIAQSNGIDDQTMEKRYLTVRGILTSESERGFWLAHEVSEDMEGPRRIFVRVLLEDGAVLEETPDMAAFLPASEFPTLRPGQELRRASLAGAGGQHYRAMVGRAPIVMNGSARSGSVQIAIDTTLDQAVLRRFEGLVLIVAVVALAAAMLLSAWQFLRLLAPLQTVTREMETIDQNSLDRRIDTGRMTDEMRALGHQFNALLDRLQIAYQGLRQYADNVAHEIRTPLNALVLGLNLAERQARTPAEYDEFIADLAENCRQLNALVERLLFLARASSGQATILRQLVDLTKEVEGIRELFAASASEAHVALKVEMDDSVAISADRSLLQRAVGNLVSNAIAHTPAGGEVRVLVRQEGDVARIEVIDTGVGIAPCDLPFVFDRFYRADRVRAPNSGVGLGLPITKSIVDLHGGSVTLESEPGKGTRATVLLPIAGGRLPAAA